MKSLFAGICCAVALGCLPLFLGVAHGEDSKNTSTPSSLFSVVSNRYKEVFAGKSFYYYTRADRVQVVEDLIREIDAKYSLLEIKKTRVGVDLEVIGPQALSAEKAVIDVFADSEQATSNLQFIDRLRVFVAKFQDTHFGIRAFHNYNPVGLGMGFARLGDGRVIISSVTPKLQAFNDARAGSTAFSELAPGDELVSIDGKLANDAVAELVPYVSGSSELFRLETAASYLSGRTFAFPIKSVADLKIKKLTGTIVNLRMPWFYRDGAFSAPMPSDEERYLKDRNFTQNDELRMTVNGNKFRMTGLEVINDDFTHKIKQLIGEQNYFDLDDNVDSLAIKTGYIVSKDGSSGYLQVNTFGAEKVYDGKTSLSFFEPIQNFIADLNVRGLPLILDLRDNGGGMTSYPPRLLSLLAPSGATYPNDTHAYRVTRYAESTVRSEFSTNALPEELEGYSIADFLSVFPAAISKGELHTAALSGPDIQSVIGYSGKIVALISSSCISACDIMSMLLKTSGRATLVGEPANGTGAGFTSSGPDTTAWQDTYYVSQSRIPSFLFGRPLPAGVHMQDGVTEELNMENRPTQPDVLHAWTARDVTDGSQDWINAAMKELAK